MSGTWRERLDARLPLRERDVSAALRELGADDGRENATSDIEGLSQRVETLETAVVSLTGALDAAAERLAALEATLDAALTPAQRARAEKATGE